MLCYRSSRLIERRGQMRADLLCWTLLVTTAIAIVQVRVQASDPIDFDRDVRPVLADHCFPCHGPDEGQRQAELRLDQRRTALAVMVPGEAEQSELIRRLTTSDHDQRMPPTKTGRRPTAEEVQRIVDWIEQGAEWEEHWAFLAPSRPPLPEQTAGSRSRNAVDRFVFARLQRQGLRPSPPASKTSLIRRVCLDLIGLPPSPSEVRAFLEDDQPGAYERMVDRYLASPRFGERLALPWLDAARYADTSGYQNDGPRQMWRWRDWLIDALNQNMPFDQFTIEQLAGDLLPEAKLHQQIATGFNRNHRGNAEGGIIPEEYAVEYVVDRVETTATVWLGLTVGCARCHDHKFDPISQREFYRFYAFFNNVPEFGRAIKEGNSPPTIKAPTANDRRRLARLEREVSESQHAWETLRPRLQQAQVAWERTNASDRDWTITRGLVRRVPLNGELLAKEAASVPRLVAGRVGQAAAFDGQASLEVGDVGNFGYFDKFTIALWIWPEDSSDIEQRPVVSRMMTDTPNGSGYQVSWQDGHLHVNLVKRWLDDAIRVRSARQLPVNTWSHVCVTYDGSRKAAGIKLFVDGVPTPLVVELDLLNQSFATSEPLRLGAVRFTPGFVGRMDDVHVYRRVLAGSEVVALASPAPVTSILQRPTEERSPHEQQKLHLCFLDRHAPGIIQAAHQRLLWARQRYEEYWEAIPTVMVMQELPQPRATFVLERGQYDRPREQVTAGTPAWLPPLPADKTPDRLTLARWIVDPANPLTARVAVNRYWQMMFGRGLVETPEDFGSQGRRPSHPELLDWLAVEFVHSGWDVKTLIRTLVRSATYRQTSQVPAEMFRRDPANRWYARGPRFRLRAELVRDQALAASGLLIEQLGGPSVRPYQPEGLWKEIASDTDYQQSRGSGLYRRSLYTYWKRTVAPPAMVTLDATTRETCVVRPHRTNTPLQALTLLNDVTFLEASRALAERVLREAGPSAGDRIRLAFQLVTARAPGDRELMVLLEGFRDHQQTFRADLPAAKALTQIGELAATSSSEASDVAALMVICNLLFNLDETLTKE